MFSINLQPWINYELHPGTLKLSERRNQGQHNSRAYGIFFITWEIFLIICDEIFVHVNVTHQYCKGPTEWKVKLVGGDSMHWVVLTRKIHWKLSNMNLYIPVNFKWKRQTVKPYEKSQLLNSTLIFPQSLKSCQEQSSPVHLLLQTVHISWGLDGVCFFFPNIAHSIRTCDIMQHMNIWNYLAMLFILAFLFFPYHRQCMWCYVPSVHSYSPLCKSNHLQGLCQFSNLLLNQRSRIQSCSFS